MASRPHCHHRFPFQLPGDLLCLPLLDLGGELPRPLGLSLSSSPCSLTNSAGPRALSSSEASYNTFIHQCHCIIFIGEQLTRATYNPASAIFCSMIRRALDLSTPGSSAIIAASISSSTLSLLLPQSCNKTAPVTNRRFLRHGNTSCANSQGISSSLIEPKLHPS